jgi:NAD(P)-dependent dehydrogenase (short-subunit alcohol dehydrogenase family)
MKNSYYKNKNIVITGGTSGLGRALAIQLDKAGANVMVIARRQELIEKLINEHTNIVGIQGDISDKKTIHSIAAEVHTKLQEVDILFNIASYLGQSPLRSLLDTECEDFEKVLQTNVLGPFRLTKLLAPSMVLREKGIVVNISSDAAINPYSTWGSYSVSKAAVDHMSRIFNEELKDSGVHFLSVDPGDMATPMHFAAIPEANADDLRDPKESANLLAELVASEDYSEVRRAL